MARKSSAVAVHIVLDTNSLFTEAADKLIRAELSQFILSLLGRGEVDITWHLPEIVHAERKHQMMVRARRLLPHLGKVENLLGCTFGITDELLEERVDAAIKREIERHKIEMHALDVSKVNWDELISRSVQRRPPFDPGENEKGFRDAVVLETFCQLIEDLPKSPQSCRIVLMSGDSLLTEVAREKTSTRANVAFTGDLEEIRTMLNALASELTQEVVSKILPKASEMFFTKGNDKSLYYSEAIYNRITSDFGQQLANLPDKEFTKSVAKIIRIGQPTFLAKKGQRLTFSSRVTYEVEAAKIVWRSPPALHLTSGVGSTITSPSNAGLSGGLFGAVPTGVVGSPAGSTLFIPPLRHDLGTSRLFSGAGLLAGLSGITPSLGPTGTFGVLSNQPSAVPQLIPEEIRRDGEHVFEITWHATLTAAGKLTKPKVEKIEHKSTSWQEQP
jgi:hypothetical protein